MNPDRWQPLTYTDANGNLVVQMFEAAQWGRVRRFSDKGLAEDTDQSRGGASGTKWPASKSKKSRQDAGATKWDGSGGDKNADSEVGPYKGAEKSRRDAGGTKKAFEEGPAKYGTKDFAKEAEELVTLSGKLTDKQKMLAEYWTEAPGKESTAEHWMKFAKFVCERDHATLDDEVKLLFALSNALMDADIAAWDAKRTYDSGRPATTVPLIMRGKKIRAWGGPGKGTVEMDGGQWVPYQPATLPTPASPEYVSETSAESAAAARVLELWTLSEQFGYEVEFAKGSSRIEPASTPSVPVKVKWETFREAANDAEMAGRWAGIQFARSDLAGRMLGRATAEKVLSKANVYFARKNSIGAAKENE